MASARVRRATFPGALALGCLGLAGGCLSSQSSLPVYDTSQIGSVIKSESGEILSVRDVVIKAPSSSAGSTGMGARIGAAAGRSAVSGGAVGAATAVVGETVGAIAGAGVDNVRGEEITILVEGGQVITVVQPRGNPPFATGERVRIVSGTSSGIYGGGNTRVLREN